MIYIRTHDTEFEEVDDEKRKTKKKKTKQQNCKIETVKREGREVVCSNE